MPKLIFCVLGALTATLSGLTPAPAVAQIARPETGYYTAAAEPAAPLWSARGLFTFGPLVIDFWSGYENDGGPLGRRLVNCSTEEFYCAQARIVNVALPRSCPAEPTAGTVWRVGSVETEVLGEQRYPLSSHLPTRSFYLGSESNPHIVYEWVRSGGVRAIIWDPLNRLDLVQMARSGELPVFRQNAGARYVLPLETFDAFGYCR